MRRISGRRMLLAYAGLLHGHEIRHPPASSGRVECRGEGIGIAAVGARGRKPARGTDAVPAADARIQQPAKQCGTVELRTTAPVNRAVDGHKGRGMSIADQRVIADRPIRSGSLARCVLHTRQQLSLSSPRQAVAGVTHQQVAAFPKRMGAAGEFWPRTRALWRARVPGLRKRPPWHRRPGRAGRGEIYDVGARIPQR